MTTHRNLIPPTGPAGVPDFRLKVARSERGHFEAGSTADEFLGIADVDVELLWVGRDMVHLAEAASVSFPLDAQVTDIHARSQSGFIVLEEPFSVVDSSVAGGPITQFVDTLVWSLVPPDEHRDFHTLILVTIGVCGDGIERARSMGWSSPSTLGGFDLEGGAGSGSTQLLQVLATILALVDQPGMTTSSTFNPDRASRKRSQRAGLGAPTVQVVTLRRCSTSSDGHHVAGPRLDRNHRWIVAGHWRNQACGPNHSERRWIWIDQYIKGPDDKPLVTDRVLSLVR